MRRTLISLAVVGALIGIPALILQRWIAETRFAAIVLVLAWFAIVAIALVVYVWRRPAMRLPVLGSFAVILAGTVAIGYVTGFRDMVVDEDVATAAERAPAAERERGLSGGAEAAEPRPVREPVELARGSFTGEDGHAGTGIATVVGQPGGERVLTFTEFDVDPGVDVDVYLSAGPEGIDDAVKIDDLKGNVGDQQYGLPADVDLRRYSNVVLWCHPFTVRIAIAELDA
jgi:hypothetical protein